MKRLGTLGELPMNGCRRASGGLRSLGTNQRRTRASRLTRCPDSLDHYNPLMNQSRLREITREQFVLAVRLGALLSGSGIVFWQLMRATEPMASGIFVVVPAEVRTVGAAILFPLTLLALLILVRRNLRKPMRQLAAYVAEQNIGNTQRLPSVLLDRTDDVGRLTREISRLIDKMTEQNEQLLEQTLYDPLTGLGNRRLLQRRLEAILPLNQRMMMPLSALMIDVDQLIACADSALYECKRLGCNRSFCQTVTAESLAD